MRNVARIIPEILDHGNHVGRLGRRSYLSTADAPSSASIFSLGIIQSTVLPSRLSSLTPPDGPKRQSGCRIAWPLEASSGAVPLKQRGAPGGIIYRRLDSSCLS